MSNTLAVLLVAFALGFTTTTAYASEVTGQLSTGGTGETPAPSVTQASLTGKTTGGPQEVQHPSELLVASISGGVEAPDNDTFALTESSSSLWIGVGALLASVLAIVAGTIYLRRG